MNIFTRFIYTLIAVCGISASLQAQYIDNVSIPSGATSCTTTSIDVTGEKDCSNAVTLPLTQSVSGNTINITMGITVGMICAPVIIPFTQTATFNNLPGGTYTVIVTFQVNGGQTDQQTFSMNVISCCNINSGFTASATTICAGTTVNFAASDNTLSNYHFRINGADFGTAATASHTFNTVGTYTVHMLASGTSCSDSSSTTINVVAAPSINPLSTVSESCTGSLDGSVSISVSGGVAPITYNWSNGATTSNLTHIAAGNYTLTVSAANGCPVATHSFTVNNLPAVQADYTMSTGDSICVGTTVQFTSTSANATSLSWQQSGTGMGNSVSVSHQFTQAGLIPVRLIAARNALCRDTLIRTLYVEAGPSLSATTVNESCAGAMNGSVAVTATQGIAPYSYHWTSGQITSSISNLTAGVYNVVVRDSLGCSNSGSYHLTTNPATTAGINTSGVTSICALKTLHFMSSSVNATQYAWYMNGSLLSTAMDTAYTFNTSGAYTVKLVVHNSGFCSDSTTLTISVLSLPILTPAIVNNNCTGATNASINVSVNGSGPFAYNWSNNATTNSINNLTDGSYTVSVSDDNGCTVEDTYTVTTLGTVPVFTAVSNDNHCPGGADGSINVMVSSPATVSYLWSNNATTSNISNLAAGSYTVTISDPNGCSAVNTYTVTTLSSGVQAGFNFVSMNTALIQVTNTSTGSNLQYTWTFHQLGGVATDTSHLALPSYNTTFVNTLVCLHVTDQYGCTSDSCLSYLPEGVINTGVKGFLKSYPNPVASVCHIELPDNTTTDFTISISDITGSIISAPVSRQANSISIDMQQLAKGMYYIRLSNDKDTWTSSVIKD